jgi:D-alanine-D-alanine ligase
VDKLLRAKPDVAFIALHGKYGEDGIMQGVLEFLNIPYVGCGVESSAVSMNKATSYRLMEHAGISVPKWEEAFSEKDLKNTKLKYPMVIKPTDGGSAIGVFIVKNEKEALPAFKKAQKICKSVILQEFIKGIEITVPVYFDRVLPMIEIVPANEFYDFEAKYTAGKSNHIIPARISKQQTKKAADMALAVHKALMCKDMSRVDMIVNKKGIYVLETNTLPGMTPTSLYPEAAKAAGISFYELILALLKSSGG